MSKAGIVINKMGRSQTTIAPPTSNTITKIVLNRCLMLIRAEFLFLAKVVVKPNDLGYSVQKYGY